MFEKSMRQVNRNKPFAIYGKQNDIRKLVRKKESVCRILLGANIVAKRAINRRTMQHLVKSLVPFGWLSFGFGLYALHRYN